MRITGMTKGVTLLLFSVLTLSGCKRERRITVLEYSGEPVANAQITVWFGSSGAMMGTTDGKGRAFFKMKHPEYVQSVGIFPADGRRISVSQSLKWPMTVRIGPYRDQHITSGPENR